MDKPTSSNTVTEIKAWLDENGIDYSSTATKSELLALIPDDEEPTDTEPDTGDETPVDDSEPTEEEPDNSDGDSDDSDEPVENDPEPETPVYEPAPWERMLTPDPEPIVTQPAGPTYVVQPGETLTMIANKLMMSVNKLKKLNGLTVDVVPAGRVLKLA